jgi:hypothetical protein
MVYDNKVATGPGGSVKAEGLGDGPAHGKAAIAKLRLTLPPVEGLIEGTRKRT